MSTSEKAAEHLSSIDPQTLDPAFDEEMTERRNALKRAGKLGLALAAAPLAFGTFTRNTFAQDGGLPQVAIDALNFALQLEYLERNFYRMALDTDGLIPGGEERAIFEKIYAHEAAHVQLIDGALSGDAVTEPSFDFTAGGTFDPFGDYQQFLALAQGFEDTGVRAYKGQAGGFAGRPALADLLGTALQIHSSEARHAARVRRLRGNKGWIPGDGDQTELAALAPVYDGEGNTMQGPFDLGDALGNDFSTDAITESFDEPLSMEAVLGIAGQFIVQDDGSDGDDNDSD